ncbi:hypothetical protein B0O99DRAFT_636695 [Bisporella sp. PMI_857]|nr:hypothetical protein B0O99DRAFT_636695 [Bisporella sp. PMI_857]
METLARRSTPSTGAIPVSTNEGRWWVESWNKSEAAKSVDGTLKFICRHDSRRGPQIKDYTFGLDSKCSTANRLRHLIILESKGGNAGVSCRIGWSVCSTKTVIVLDN